MDQVYIHHVFGCIALHEAKRAFSNQYHLDLLKFASLFVFNYNQEKEIVSEVLIKLLKNRKILHHIESIDEQDFYHLENDKNLCYDINTTTFGIQLKTGKSHHYLKTNIKTC